MFTHPDSVELPYMFALHKMVHLFSDDLTTAIKLTALFNASNIKDRREFARRYVIKDETNLFFIVNIISFLY